MPKINYEEYEVLKNLDDKWKWIARDKNKTLWVYEAKPDKGEWRMWEMSDNGVKRMIDDDLFEFVQWKDEEPHNIAELIEEYEDSKEYTDSLMIKHFIDKANESEKTEMKKDKKWLRAEVERLQIYGDSRVRLVEVLGLINQLDEPEVLSQELPVVPIWFDEWWKNVTKGETNLFHNIERFHDELFSSGTSEMFNYIISQDNKKKLLNIIINELEYVVEEEQKYVISINIVDKDSETNYETFLNKRGIFHSMKNDSFNNEQFNWSEEEIRELPKGDILFEHFAVKVEELEE